MPTLNRSSLDSAIYEHTPPDLPDSKRPLTGSSKDRVSVGQRVGIETTYSWLSWHTSGDDDDVGTSKDLGQAVIRGKVADDLRRGRDVRQIRGDTGRVDDIVQPELAQGTSANDAMGTEDGVPYLCHGGVALQQQRQRLADTTCSLFSTLSPLRRMASTLPAAPRTTALTMM